MTPQRLQRRRSRGWRTPEGAVYVGRPSRWGNPFHVKPASSTRGGPLDMWAVVHEGRTLVGFDDRRAAAQDAVDRYRRWIVENGLEAEIRAALAGRDLLCWCRVGDTCHADILLRIAAGGSP